MTHLHSDESYGYILMHEVHSLAWLATRPDFQAYAARYHTTSVQLAEVTSRYSGHVVVGRDLDVYRRAPPEHGGALT